MRSRFTLATVLTLLLPALALAQGGNINTQGSGLSDGGLGPRALTPAETFMARLKLDEKTQVPQAEQVLIAAMREAAPVSTQLLQLRQAILNAEISKDPAAIQQATAAYADAASKLAAINAAAFAKIYATLKPNQQGKSAEAFELLPVIIAPGTPARGGGRAGGMGRGGAQ